MKEKNLNYYKEKLNTCTMEDEKVYYQQLVAERLILDHAIRQKPTDELKPFTLEELSYYNGEQGKPAYVAVNKIVYDVSLNKTWGGSTHFGLFAGQNLTKEFMECHGNIDKLNQLPKVGILIDSEEDPL